MKSLRSVGRIVVGSVEEAVRTLMDQNLHLFGMSLICQKDVERWTTDLDIAADGSVPVERPDSR